MVPNDWSLIKLKDIGKCINGLTYNPKNVVSEGLLVLRSSNVQNSKLAFTDNVYVDIDVADASKTKSGDILLCVRNGSRNLIGKSAFIDDNNAGLAHGAFMSLFRPIDTPEYTFQLFQSSKFFQQVNHNLGATINSINNGNLNQFKFPYPPLDERIKIAKILSTWDKAISTTEKLIETSKQQKKALMQQLLTGKKRLVNPETGEKFDGEWEEVKLSQLVKVTGGNAFKSEQFATQGIPLIKISNIKADYSVNVDSSGFIEEESKYEKFKVKAGDVLIAMSGATTGKVGCYRFDDFSYLNQRVGRFDPKKNKVTKPYLFQLLKLPKVQHDILIDAVGGAQPNISNKDIERLKVKVPVIGEQQKIASVLTTADKEIELLVAKLAHFKQEKKALMQQLLTGKRRVAEE
ncbi:restriction endonuclease subunit S [Marinomonas polaris]|uniref:restriction endonuclease subunit S n=1 Tax=Marinomonas polaris TaxID=293552 RepID=UPI003F9DD3DC